MSIAVSPSIHDRQGRSTCRSEPRARPLSGGGPTCRRGEGIEVGAPLARYADDSGRSRELFAIPGLGGSVLLIDRDAATLCDRRLVAHLAPDEPHENVGLVCRHYLADAGGHRCRLVRPEDLEVVPFAQHRDDDAHGETDCVVDDHGNVYRLRLVTDECSRTHLRWCRRPCTGDSGWEQSSLRDVIAAIESYEPMRTLTERAIERHGESRNVSVTRLRYEFERLCISPVVLNRGVREAVLHAIDRQDTSMSEIALRCGIVKHDRRGRASGETSWLARRIGIMPEGGERTTTPWIHSDVLAVIARDGLGISPREVELQ
jgi:hypothetical protein